MSAPIDRAASAADEEVPSPALRIEAVDHAEPRSGIGVTIDRPEPASASELFAIDFHGSAPREAGVRSVQFLCYDEVVAETPVDIDQGQGRIGFRTRIGAFRLPPRFTIEVGALVEGADPAAVARVSGTRASLGPGEEEGTLSPVLVTSPTGRTGTTWLVTLLGAHPSLIAYPHVGVEPRVASYWAEAMGFLAEPASYMRLLRPQMGRFVGETTAALGDRMEKPHWFLGAWPEATRGPIPDREVARFLGRQGVERLAAIARERVEAFYRLAARQQQKQPSAFVEKAPLGRVRLEVIEDLFGSLREVALFRDPRDTLCSILAYQAGRPGATSAKRPGATLVGDSVEAGERDLEGIARSFAGLLEQTRERGDRALVVRYEDLVQRPVPTLRRVFAHLGVADHREAVERVLALATEDRREQHRTSSDAASSIGRWRRDLDPEVHGMANEVFAAVLDELGYDPGPKPARRRPAVKLARREVSILAAPRSGAAWLAKLLSDLPGVVVEAPNGDGGAAAPSEATARSPVILLVRDPRSAIASDLGAQAGEDPDAPVRARAADYVREVEAAKRAYDSHPGAKALISYERLRYAPLDTLRELRRRLELPVTELDLAHVVAVHDRERVPADDQGSGKPGAEVGVSDWRDDLSPEQVHEIERIAAPMLEEHYAAGASAP